MASETETRALLSISRDIPGKYWRKNRNAIITVMSWTYLVNNIIKDIHDSMNCLTCRQTNVDNFLCMSIEKILAKLESTEKESIQR